MEIKTNNTLALKYRPRKFEDLAGHADIVTGLKGMLKSQELPNAYAIVGLSGTGKCVVGSTLVNSHLGLVPIKDLIQRKGYHEINSVVLQNGYGHNEVASHSYKRKAFTIKVDLLDGRSIEGTPNHPIMVINSLGEREWKRLDQINGNDLVITSNVEHHTSKYRKTQYQCRTRVFDNGVLPKPFPKPEYLNEDVAFILGCLVAEGSLSLGYRCVFHNTDKRFMRQYKQCWRNLDPSIDIRSRKIKGKTPSCWISKGYNYGKYLESCGLVFDVSSKQRVPHEIMKSPESVKRAFLTAYFEGDGGWQDSTIFAYSSSKRLLLDIQALLQTFGIYSKVSLPKKVICQTKISVNYALTIDPSNAEIFMEKIGFFSKRKNNHNFDKNRNPNYDWAPRIILNAIHKALDEHPGFRLNGKHIGELDTEISQQLKLRHTSKPAVIDYLHTIDKIYKYVPQEVQKHLLTLTHLVQINARCVGIRRVTKSVKKKWVYDFTLPRTHSFIANGIVNHNTTIGRMIARYLNCETQTGCGKCQSCKEMDAGANMDYTEINASESGNIETVRKQIEAANFKPRYNVRVILWDEVHRFSVAAVNALLKPLEEPPAHTLWILCTTDPEKIPNYKAVLGRCTMLNLSPPTKEEIAKRLSFIAKKESFNWLSKDNALDIAEASGGHVRDAVQILESVARHIKGLDKVPKKKKLSQLVHGLAVKNVDGNTDKLAMNILIGIYSKDVKRCQKAILETEDYTAMINKLLYLNMYLVNKLILGSHSKIWDTVVSKGLWNYLNDKDIKLKEKNVLLVHEVLTQLKEKASAYLVGGDHLFTAALTTLCLTKKR